MKSLILFLLIFSVGFAQSNTKPPAGYRKITNEDYKNGFEENLKFNPLPYYTSGDFDGNGIKDEAWLFVSIKNKRWGLFTYLKYKNDKIKIIELESDTNTANLTNYYVSTANPGTYKTACGKGYWNCEKNETPEIKLTIPSIDFGIFESGNSFFYWVKKEKKFERIWISD